MSVTASDDVDITSTSTTSMPEPDLSLPLEDSKSLPSSTKTVSPTSAKGPVTLLRRQLPAGTTLSTPHYSRQATPGISGDATQPSTPSSKADVGPPASASKEMVDPALLEAFANPMNRQYLLQLEASLNNFVSQARYPSPNSTGAE